MLGLFSRGPFRVSRLDLLYSGVSTGGNRLKRYVRLMREYVIKIIRLMREYVIKIVRLMWEYVIKIIVRYLVKYAVRVRVRVKVIDRLM